MPPGKSGSASLTIAVTCPSAATVPTSRYEVVPAVPPQRITMAARSGVSGDSAKTRGDGLGTGVDAGGGSTVGDGEAVAAVGVDRRLGVGVMTATTEDVGRCTDAVGDDKAAVLGPDASGWSVDHKT